MEKQMKPGNPIKNLLLAKYNHGAEVLLDNNPKQTAGTTLGSFSNYHVFNFVFSKPRPKSKSKLLDLMFTDVYHPV